MKDLGLLFESYMHERAENIVELPSSGSNRRYFRLWGKDRTLIGVRGTSREENIAFCKLSDHFVNKKETGYRD